MRILKDTDTQISYTNGTKRPSHAATNVMAMTMMMRCRKIPQLEIAAVARYLASLFSCDVESLPTEFLTHPFWTTMPDQFASAGDYRRCLHGGTRSFAHAAHSCRLYNPHYCGRRFGQQAFLDRLTVCHQLLSGRDTPNYEVPQPIRATTRRFRTCLDNTRTAVVIQNYGLAVLRTSVRCCDATPIQSPCDFRVTVRLSGDSSSKHGSHTERRNSRGGRIAVASQSCRIVVTAIYK